VFRQPPKTVTSSAPTSPEPPEASKADLPTPPSPQSDEARTGSTFDATVEAEKDRWLPWLTLLFVGSGCAALIYEIVWLQMLQLVIGLTSVSLGILLGTFMGGMCLGSLWLPRLISERFHPLRVYAFLELGIAALALGVLLGLPWVSPFYASVGGRGLTGVLVRGLLAAVCLLPPTILMGATLPALARWIDTSRQGISWLGFFYGGNIAGAVVGCLAAGFYLLRVHDVAIATYAGAGLSVAVALAALALAARTRGGSPEPKAHRITTPNSGSRLVYLVIALSGMSALGAEVVWTRLLSLTLGGTVYTFSIILAVFLIGLGLGSTTGSAAARTIRSPERALGICQLLLTAGVAWTALMISHSLPYWPINPAITTSPWYLFQLDFARCLWSVLPAACCWGASFPLALASVAEEGQDPGRVVGTVYAANTVGAILGALIFSLVIVPRFGTQNAQRVLIGLAAVAALVAFARPCRRPQGGSDAALEPRKWTDRITAAAAVLALAGCLAWSISPAPWGLVAYGRYMATWLARLAPGIRAEKDVPQDDTKPDIYCTYLGEGMNGSVAVTQWTSGVKSFCSAGKVQASTEAQDMRLQRMLGHLSALTHKGPESVLVVACGAGITAGAFVVHPTVKRIVICDIEPLVPQRVAPMFAKENYGVVADPRTEVVSDDGRHFLRTTSEQFDIITSDPIDPWVKGCAALNTVEYYELCKAHLKPGGVMSLWIPFYEGNQITAKSVIATFFKVFPNGILCSNDEAGEGYDAVLLGQAGPLRYNIDEIYTRLGRADHARVRDSMRDAGFNSATSLLATYAGRPSDLGEWLRDAQINTDHNLRLQYLAGMWLNSYEGSEILNKILNYRKFPEDLFVGSGARRDLLRIAITGSTKTASSH